MSNIDDRRKAFEDKFRMDAEVTFKHNARIIRKLAFWTAEALGQDETAEEHYAKKIVDIILAKGFDAAMTQLHDDFMTKENAVETDFTAARLKIERSITTKSDAV